MNPTTIDVPPLDLRAAVGDIHEDTRTVDLIFSTGADVTRFDWNTGKRYIERLSMDPKHVRLDRLNAGAPLLNAHSAYSLADQIGIVETATLTGKEGRATVRFSRRADVEPIYQDVKDKIVRNVSVGYRVHRFEESDSKTEIPIRMATDWEPFEISMVPMGADAGARVRSSKDVETNPCVIVRAAQQEEVMAEETKKVDETVQPPAAPVDEVAVRAAGVQAERERITGIQSAVRIAKLDEAFAADLVARNVTLDQARSDIFAKMAAVSDATRVNPHIEVGEDVRDKWVRGAGNWLLIKSGMAGVVAKAGKVSADTIDPGEFRGSTLLDLVKQSLERAGRPVRGVDKMRLIGDAFTLRAITQSTSDFPVLLENVAGKVLQAAYATMPDTWRRFCAVGTVPNFLAHNRYRMGSFGALDTVAENGEFHNKAIPDGEKATITAVTKGNIINVSRQMIMNDDMGAFSRLAAMLGRAAALSVEADVYALLALNSGLGPTMSDSAPLFDDAAHHNVSTGAAISAAALDADRVKMAIQTDVSGHEYIGLRPSILLVSPGQYGVAKVINTSATDPDTLANKSNNKPNIALGLFADIVDNPRITSPRRYLFADPQVAAVLEVAFLEGQSEPVVETQDGWRVDGAEMKVRLDYGVAAVDYRGAVTNAGS